MIKLNILDMEDFLEAVNGCIGEVNLLGLDGGEKNIKNHDEAQRNLWREYTKNRQFLEVSLDIPDPRDYMNIVFSSIANC